jgi:hypothetical protein
VIEQRSERIGQGALHLAGAGVDALPFHDVQVGERGRAAGRVTRVGVGGAPANLRRPRA